MAQNAAVLSERYFFVDLLGGIVFFPVWWYTLGLARVGRMALRALDEERRSLAIGVWIKNLFVPMYNANDIAGRLISFFMRTVQIIGRTIVFAVYFILVAALFTAYLLLPVFVVLQILYHAFSILLL